MSGDRITVRVYRALVNLYPRRFRDEYGTDMVALLRDQCADEPAWRVCGRALVDLALTVPNQQLEAHMRRTPNHLVPLLYAAIAITAALAALVAGTNVAGLIGGACIAVVAGALAAIAWRRNGPVGATTADGAWWKFVVAGPCIIAVVIIAAGLGVDAWFVGVASVLLAFVLTGVGLLLGLVRIANRRSGTLST